MTLYEQLKCYGHSPAIAATIALDCKRGLPYALAWAQVVCRATVQP